MDSCTIHGEPITNTLSGMGGTPLRSPEDRTADAAERQAAAWERIATAVEALAAVLTVKPVVIPRTPRNDMVYGPGRWQGPSGPIELDPKRTR